MPMNIKKRIMIPVLCSAQLMLLLSAVHAETGAADANTSLKILKAEATSPTTFQITLNQKLNSFQPADLQLQSALGDWTSLNPQLTPNFSLKQSNMTTNDAGQTVITLETNEAVRPDATIPRPVTEDPKKVPFLNTAYYTGDRAKDIQQADYLLSWQMEHGGWYKFSTQYKRAWNGTEKRSDWLGPNGVELGTIDNNATTNEILFLSVMYKETGDIRYREAVQKGIGFLLRMQYPTGGWAQVYPARNGYSDYVTFNDNAMIRVMNVLKMAKSKAYPFNTDILSEDAGLKIQESLDRGLDFILKSQIKVGGLLTAWCAQHDPVTYEPRGARAYEHPSISGSESIEIIKYLIAHPDETPEIRHAVDSALGWFDANKLSGINYISGDPNNVYFVPNPAVDTWYRFYQIGTNKPIFSGRDGVIKHNILEIEEERRNGYRWAGSWAQKLLQTMKTTGYYEGRVFVKIVGSESRSETGQAFTPGELKRIEDAIAPSLELVPPGRKTGNHYNVDSASLVLKGSLNEAASVKVNGVDAEALENLGFESKPTALQPGQNEITITAVDKSGNSASASVQVVPTGEAKR